MRYIFKLFILLLILSSCGEGDESKYTIISIVDADNKFVDGANIRVYETSADYYLGQNEIYSFDNNNEEKITLPIYRDDLIVSAEKGDLNSIRWLSDKLRYNFGYYTSRNDSRYTYIVKLLPTPTKLQITVLHDGDPVPLADVDLYISETGYQNDIAPYNEDENAPDNISYSLRTDNSGVVYFEDLEPRIYWFRITKNDLSNDGGTISLDTPLPANQDITTTITIGIN